MKNRAEQKKGNEVVAKTSVLPQGGDCEHDEDVDKTEMLYEEIRLQLFGIVAEARKKAFEECREMVDSEQLNPHEPYVKLGIEAPPYSAIETHSWNKAVETILNRLDGKIKEL